MNLIGKLVVFCLLIAALQKVTQLLLVVVALTWICAFIVKPAEMIGLLLLMTLAACIRTHPGLSLISFLLLFTAAVCITMAEPDP
ncbi:hypothetical protein A8B75_18510 [Sphingomonadales bacterium EhC05]|nr:hypothetical protein A8B75_18510 [Sphingomonadales bacterium EhC05]